MLNARLGTAAVLAPAVVAAILVFPPYVGALIFALFLLLASWEWTALIELRAGPWRATVAGCVLLMAGFYYLQLDNRELMIATQVLAVGLWLAIVILIVRFQHSAATRLTRWARTWPICVLLLAGAWCAVVGLLHSDPSMLLLVFVCIWVADSAAYFVGQRFGRTKLAPRISPGKSWEGVAGGLGFSFLALLAGCQLLVLSAPAKWALVAVGMLAVCASVVGDLFESILKRSSGIKDSGTMLPGHGGVLDRIDGLVAALPVFSLGVFLWVNKL